MKNELAADVVSRLRSFVIRLKLDGARFDQEGNARLAEAVRRGIRDAEQVIANYEDHPPPGEE